MLKVNIIHTILLKQKWAHKEKERYCFFSKSTDKFIITPTIPAYHHWQRDSTHLLILVAGILDKGYRLWSSDLSKLQTFINQWGIYWNIYNNNMGLVLLEKSNHTKLISSIHHGMVPRSHVYSSSHKKLTENGY